MIFTRHPFLGMQHFRLICHSSKCFYGYLADSALDGKFQCLFALRGFLPPCPRSFRRLWSLWRAHTGENPPGSALAMVGHATSVPFTSKVGRGRYAHPFNRGFCCKRRRIILLEPLFVHLTLLASLSKVPSKWLSSSSLFVHHCQALSLWVFTCWGSSWKWEDGDLPKSN